MSAPNGRKRPAPGAAPAMNFPQQSFQPNPAPNDQLQRWNNLAMNGNDMANFIDTNGGIDGLANAYDLSQFQQPPNNPGSNSLARRPMNNLNNALVPTNFAPGQDLWLTDERGLITHGGGEASPETDSVEVLEEKAQKAKRDAQGKRKQIPPFVQKLSSFLEEGKNEDLIRWSEKGDSFIVIDEDEFAKTLIPELFKHNNYASFVRQLNMYGFHKKVGLSDNSMRASERKNKSPSEYSNPYFRRGHPNLLWLISKPKSGSKAKKGAKGGDGDFDSDDDGSPDLTNAQAVGSGSAQPTKSLPAPEQPSMPKKDMQLIKQEIKQLRDGQQRVMATLQQISQNNNDLYNQAALFQSQHDRHQNSINAILSFLANVFRKTLEDQGGNASDVGQMFSSLMTPQGGQQGGQATGSVVDLGDFFQQQSNTSSMGGTPSKKPMRLLLPPPTNPEAGRAQTASRSPSNASTPAYRPNRNPSMATVTEIQDSPADTPPSLRQELESNPQERMMKIINDHNATNPNGAVPDAADLVANAPNGLDHDQRSRLVNLMANQSSAPQNMNGTTATHNPEPPKMPSNANSPPQNPPSLSPIMRSPAVQPPNMTQIASNQAELAELQRIQNEQSAKINELSEYLGPLSPSGQVPGLTDDTDPNYFDPPADNFNDYFHTEQFLPEDPTAAPQGFGDGNDFNFDITGNGGNIAAPGTNGGGNGFGGGLQVPDMGGGGQQTGSAPGTGGNNTPSPAGTEEIPRGDLGFLDDRTGKRRRIS